MNLQKIVDAFSEEKRSTKPSDRGEPGAVLFFNSSFKEVLKSLQERQEAFQDVLSTQKERVQSLINNFSELQEMVSQLTDRIDSLSSELRGLQSEVNKLRSNTVDQEVVNELRDEASRYREDWVRKQEMGVIKKEIQLYDDLAYLENEDQISALRKSLLDILNRRDVEKIDDNREIFNPDYMKAVEVIKTDEADEDKKVHSTVKDGFKFADGELVRPMEVKIKRSAKEVQNDFTK